MSHGIGGSGPGAPEIALALLPFGIGDVIAGKYRVERLLGSGGMGVVVAGTHVGLGQPVAIKVMRPTAATNDELVARFTREARATALLRSEHVARVLDVGELTGGLPFMVMEYLAGADLSEVSKQRQGRPMPLVEIVDYVLQACEGLAEAHRAGIVHRDLKPANLFLTQTADGSPLVKVLDFGISKLSAEATGEDGLTQTQAMMGSPHYMSPEQLVSARTVDARADVYSVGAVLFRMITGEAPFTAPSTPELCVAVLTRPARAMGSIRADVPRALDDVVGRCLAKDPAHRYQDVGALASALVPFGSSSAAAMAERVRRIASTSSGSVPVPMTMPVMGAPWSPASGASGALPTLAMAVPPPMGGANTITSSAAAMPAPLHPEMGTGSGTRRDHDPGAKGALVAVGALVLVLAAGGGGLLMVKRSAWSRGRPLAATTARAAEPEPAQPPEVSAVVAPNAEIASAPDASPEAASPARAPVAAAPVPSEPTRAPRKVAPSPPASGTDVLPDFGGRK